MGVLIITHYQRILHIVQPSHVHVLYQGRIVKEGGAELVTHPRGEGLRLDPGGGRGGRRGLMSVAAESSAPAWPASSRSWPARAWSTSTRPRRRRSRKPSWIRSRPRWASTTRTSTAASTRWPSRPRIASRAPGGSSPATSAYDRGDDLHQERDRGDQPRRLLVGPAQRRRRRPDRPDAARAPHEHRPLADPRPGGRRRARLRRADEDGQLDLDSLDALLLRGPKLVAVGHISNVLGTVNPIDVITATRARRRRARARRRRPGRPAPRGRRARAAADFYVFTGHKAYGPTGIGVLAARRELLDAMPPFLGGGDMISQVDFETSRWNDLPWKFEAGTTPYAEATALGAALEWMQELGLGRDGGPRARADRLSDGWAGGTRRVYHPRPGTRATAARWSRSCSREPTRTTSPRSWAARASASARATTAPSR